MTHEEGVSTSVDDLVRAGPLSVLQQAGGGTDEGMKESDPDVEAAYQKELKKIKLQKAKEKAKKDVEREERKKSLADIGDKVEKGIDGVPAIVFFVIFIIIIQALRS